MRRQWAALGGQCRVVHEGSSEEAKGRLRPEGYKEADYDLKLREQQMQRPWGEKDSAWL